MKALLPLQQSLQNSIEGLALFQESLKSPQTEEILAKIQENISELLRIEAERIS